VFKVLLECSVFFKKTLVISVVFSFALIISASPMSYALNTESTDTITITATIEPARHVVVDQNNQITEIMTNTTSLITPIVSLNSLSGNQLEYAGSIAQQYQQIMTSCNFQQSFGVIYSSGKCTNAVNSPSDSRSILADFTSRIEADSLALFVGKIKI